MHLSREKETLAQMLSREFCYIFKNAFFTEHLRTTAFETLVNFFSNSTGLSLLRFSVLLLKHYWNIRCQTFYNRSSRSEVFCKNGVLINFAKFTGKHLRQSLAESRVRVPECQSLCQSLETCRRRLLWIISWMFSSWQTTFITLLSISNFSLFLSPLYTMFEMITLFFSWYQRFGSVYNAIWYHFWRII